MSQCELMPSPSVMLHNGRPATTSLEVGKFFDKPHKNVVRDIRNLIANCPESFTGLNFELSSYMDNTGRSLPMFIIFKDGFTLLVMGYTGPEAMRFKLVYIEAFNALEAEVQRQREGALPPAPLPLSETEKALCALRVEELERLEDEWLGFAAETRAKFGRLEREYQRTAGASFSVLLNRFPTESLVPTDAVTALLSLTVRDARTALESGLTGLHHAISASRIVNKLLARGTA